MVDLSTHRLLCASSALAHIGSALQGHGLRGTAGSHDAYYMYHKPMPRPRNQGVSITLQLYAENTYCNQKLALQVT